MWQLTLTAEGRARGLNQPVLVGITRKSRLAELDTTVLTIGHILQRPFVDFEISAIFISAKDRVGDVFLLPPSVFDVVQSQHLLYETNEVF